MLNNNFSKLIKLYEKYQKQQRNKMLLQLFSLLILLAGAYFIFTQYISTKSQLQTPSQTNKIISEDKNVKEPNNTEVSQAVENKTPSIAIQKTPVQIPKVEPMPQKVVKRTATKQEEPFQLKVTQRESLYSMLVEYKDKKSYTSAIKIAQFYLMQKDYEKAVKWAVEASKKDPTQAQSWIIYAKAKKALGKPDVAKRALTIFLKHNYSQSAQDLLNAL